MKSLPKPTVRLLLVNRFQNISELCVKIYHQLIHAIHAYFRCTRPRRKRPSHEAVKRKVLTKLAKWPQGNGYGSHHYTHRPQRTQTSRKKPTENPQDSLFIFMEVDGKRTMRENWGEPWQNPPKNCLKKTDLPQQLGNMTAGGTLSTARITVICN